MMLDLFRLNLAGYLFNADYVFHFGYGSCSSLNQWESIAVLNELVWQVQLKSKDILISGCQSGILNYDNSHIDNFAIDQYSYILGLSPDYSIICVNPHDSIDYIKGRYRLLTRHGKHIIGNCAVSS